MGGWLSRHAARCSAPHANRITVQSDEAAGRERSTGMWMGSFHDYLKHLLGGEGGSQDELLQFS